MLECLEIDDELAELSDDNIDQDKEYLNQIVRFYISNYFKDKVSFNSVDLFSPKYIDLCINTNICDGVDKAYEFIEKSGKFETSSSEHSISEDIRLVIKLLAQIKNYVPQEFSAGILLMHLEILEGVKF